MPTVVKNVYIHSTMSRTGLDWNGDHQIYNYREVGLLSRSRTGYNNPRWRQQVQAGSNATTPMTGYFDEVDSTPGNVWSKSQKPTGGGPYYTLTLSGHFGLCQALRSLPDWTPLATSTAYNRGLIAYLKNVSSVYKAFDGLTFLGELRESLRMLRRPAEGLYNLMDSFLRDVSRDKKRSPKNWKRNLSSAWLETMFGWIPLINDIQNAADAWNEGIRKKTLVLVPVSGVGVHEAPVPSRSYSQLLGSYLGIYCPMLLHTRKSTDKAVVKFRGKVRWETRATLADDAAFWGFSPEQFVPTAWNLLPWSFLVDYFSNIGDIFEAGVTNRAGIAWTNSSSIQFQIQEHMMNVAPANLQAGADRSVGGVASTAKHVRRLVNRNYLSSLGFPTLEFDLPGKPAQWANMTALFASANSIHPQRYRR